MAPLDDESICSGTHPSMPSLISSSGFTAHSDISEDTEDTRAGDAGSDSEDELYLHRQPPPRIARIFLRYIGLYNVLVSDWYHWTLQRFGTPLCAFCDSVHELHAGGATLWSLASLNLDSLH